MFTLFIIAESLVKDLSRVFTFTVGLALGYHFVVVGSKGLGFKRPENSVSREGERERERGEGLCPSGKFLVMTQQGNEGYYGTFQNQHGMPQPVPPSQAPYYNQGGYNPSVPGA